MCKPTECARGNAVRDPFTGFLTGDVRLLADTGAIVSAVGNWTYITAGVIDAIVPTSGQIGTFVTVSGSGLLGGGATIVSAQLRGVNVSEVVSSNNTHVVVRSGASSIPTGPGSVLLEADTGAIVEETFTDARLNVSQDGFFYIEPSNITNVSSLRRKFRRWLYFMSINASFCASS